MRKSPLLFPSLTAIAEAAIKHRLPAINLFVPFFAEAGGLFAYGPDFHDLFRSAAGYVDRILKGAKPADLPVQRPTKFEFIINLKTAKALILQISQSLLLRAVTRCSLNTEHESPTSLQSSACRRCTGCRNTRRLAA